MRLRAQVRDCLFLNWAVPLAGLGAAPAGLSFEPFEAPGGEIAFVSAVLFRQQETRLGSLPWPRLSHPQLNLRLYVRDDDGVAAVLFRRMWAPLWVLPGAWLLRQPLEVAHFEYPQVNGTAAAGARRWGVRDEGRLVVEAAPGSPAVGGEPQFPSWGAAVAYFRQRHRGYAAIGGQLRRVEPASAPVEAVPVAAEVVEGELIARALGLAALPPLHSAFLCPEIPFDLQLARLRIPVALGTAPAVATDPALQARTRQEAA